MKDNHFNPHSTVSTVFFPRPLIVKVSYSLPVIMPFLSRAQAAEIVAGMLRSDAKDLFMRIAVDLADVINSMPILESDCDHSIAYLHYRGFGLEWFITEKGGNGNGIDHAFGCTVSNGDIHSAVYGVISIHDLLRRGVECDLHFNPSILLSVQPCH
jgi:hypothetical protein